MTYAPARAAAAVALAAVALAACADGPADDASSTPAASLPATSPSVVDTSGSASAEANASSEPSATNPAPPADRRPAPTSPSGPRATAGRDDRTGDLVRGRRTLRGTVERAGAWVLLRTDDGRWALLGRRAAVLTTGESATVMGIDATPPADCPVRQALTVYSVN